MRSSERARDLGEVFTPEGTVNEMLDLLQDINYASKFLEPGCGSGNFLVEILSRKIDMVSRLPEDAELGLIRETKRRVLPTFAQYQIPIGSILKLTKDQNITATVDGERSVSFNGESMALSAAALSALRSMGYNWKSAHGAAYWEYDGETIWDRGERLREDS